MVFCQHAPTYTITSPKLVTELATKPAAMKVGGAAQFHLNIALLHHLTFVGKKYSFNRCNIAKIDLEKWSSKKGDFWQKSMGSSQRGCANADPAIKPL